MNEQENFWKDKYADSYIEKNTQFNFDLGVKGWRKMLQSTESEDANINSILECGPNIGRNKGFISNLEDLSSLKPDKTDLYQILKSKTRLD